jgi:hypothetical protein
LGLWDDAIMSLFKKKIKNNLRFTEIRANILNIDNNTFDRVLIENVTDKVFIKEGKIFTILPEYIQPTKYDSEIEILHGVKKIKRIFSSKKIGILWFIIDSKVIVENNRYLPKSKYEMIRDYVGYVKCNALLFKAWTESMDYKNAIRSLPNSKIMFNWKGKGKWIMLISIIVIIAFVALILTKTISIPGVNL